MKKLSTLRILPFFALWPLALLWPDSARAQGPTPIVGVLRYELDSTDEIFCRSSGLQPGANFIETVSSSTTVTAVAGTPFDAVAVGDYLLVNGLERFITAKASGASITVDSAINLDRDGGYPFQYIAFTCNTAATDGWINVSNFTSFVLSVQIIQMNASSIDVGFQCKHNFTQESPTLVYPSSSGSTDKCGSGTHTSGRCRFTAAAEGSRIVLPITEPYYACRVGLKINTDDGADTGNDAEKINVYVYGRR